MLQGRAEGGCKTIEFDYLTIVVRKKNFKAVFKTTKLEGCSSQLLLNLIGENNF